MTMTFIDAFQINPEIPTVVSFCGGGGKTSTIFQLARELAALDKSVLVATTTKIFVPELQEYDQLFIGESFEKYQKLQQRNGKITVAGPRLVIPKLKIDSIPFAQLDFLRQHNLFQFILLEADGAQRKPLKAPAEHEPVIYPETDIMVGITGFDSYQNPLSEEWVHRPELLARLAEQKLNTPVTRQTYLKLTQSPEGIFKGAPQNSRKIWILNKVDDEDQLNQAIPVCDFIKSNNFQVDVALATSFYTPPFIKHAIY